MFCVDLIVIAYLANLRESFYRVLYREERYEDNNYEYNEWIDLGGCE